MVTLMFEPARPIADRYRSTLSHPLARLGSQYQMIAMIGSGQRVLDVGCATGYWGGALKKQKSCHVVGIDIDQEAVRVASQLLDAAYVWDLEQESLPPLEQRFDWIVLGDVLEHLRRPDRVLGRLVNLLENDGTIVAAVPNIGYLPARLRVALGYFEYEDTGHFDRTHLRFFTRKTVVQLFESSGLRVIHLSYTGLPAIMPIWPSLLAAKFLVVAKPLRADRIPTEHHAIRS